MRSIFSAIIFAIGLTLMSNPTLAQSSYFEVGYQAYLRNKLGLAESYFTKALGAVKTKSDAAYVLKYIGIVRYMSGNIEGARKSFAQAYISDKTLYIFEEEVLDSSVITFYEDIRRNVDTILSKKNPSSNTSGSSQPKPSQLTQKSRSVASKSKPIKPANTKLSTNHPLAGVDFLPFGINHWKRGKNLAAGLQLTGQLFSVYMYYDLGKKIDKEKEENEKARQILQGESLETFLKDNSKYIENLSNQQTLSAVGFTLLWGTSIAYAILDSKSTLKARSKRSRYKERKLLSSENVPSLNNQQKPRMDLGLIPSTKGPLVSITLDLP